MHYVIFDTSVLAVTWMLHDSVHLVVILTSTCIVWLVFCMCLLCCCVYPLTWPLFVGGVRSSRFWFTNQHISPSGQQLHHWVCPQIQGWQCGAYVGAVEEMVCVVCVGVAEGHSGDGCDLASTLCKYDLRKGDLFVLIWARVRRLRRGSLSSELLICGGGVCSILLLPLVARCLETIDVCIWHMFCFKYVAVTVWGSVGMFVV